MAKRPTENHCQTCFAEFKSPRELRDHEDSYRFEMLELSIRIQKTQIPRASGEALHNPEENQCRTCFESFDSLGTLTAHVWAHQTELHELCFRIREASLHLPIVSKTPDRHRDRRDRSKRDDGKDDNNGQDERTGFICPHPECDVATKFKKRSHLARHYCTHVPCSELCVFCRNVFTQAQQYIYHARTCESRQEDAAKISFTKQRCTQLQSFAMEKVSDVKETGPEKEQVKTPQGVTGQRKRSRATAENEAAQSLQINLFGSSDPPSTPDHHPESEPEPDPEPEPEPEPCPDPVFPSMHSMAEFWNEASLSLLPTPPPSNFSVDAAANPQLQLPIAYFPNALPQGVEASNNDSRKRARIFDCNPISLSQYAGQQELHLFPPVYPPLSMYTGSPFCDPSAQAEGLGGLQETRGPAPSSF